jgi:5'-3' exonuclease
MGVPGLYRNLRNVSKPYQPRFIIMPDGTKKLNKRASFMECPTRLYIDANNMIHKAKEKVLNNPDINEKEIDKYIIEGTLTIIRDLITLTEPTKLIYISIDGVPPFAKALQQLSRREKSIIENKYMKEIQDKYNIKLPEWEKSFISPGTPFMSKLQTVLIKQLEVYKTNGREVIISTYHNEGEGEFKIMDHIKKNCRNREKIVIVSDDADLISLSLLVKTYIAHISIIREGLLGKEVVSMGKVRSEIANIVSEKLLPQEAYEDIVFSLLLCGNDFCPLSASLDLKMNILPDSNNSKNISIIRRIIRSSYQVFKKTNKRIVDLRERNSPKINLDSLKYLLSLLISEEENTLVQRRKRILKNNTKDINIDEFVEGEDETNREQYLYEGEIQLFKHSAINNKNHRLYEYYHGDINRAANSLVDEDEFNEEYFGGKSMDEVGKSWFEILRWTFGYFVASTPPDYLTNYEYPIAPRLNILREYLDKLSYDQEVIKYSTFIYPSPINNLMFIIPYSSGLRCINQKDIYEIFTSYKQKESRLMLDCRVGIKFIYSEVRIIDPDINILRIQLPVSHLNRVYKQPKKL